ncbi:hypothetical protein ACLOJK_034055 [Asimina triloba]
MNDTCISLSLSASGGRIIAVLSEADMGSRYLGSSVSTRRAGFGEDEGLASLADMEAGFSGKNALFSTQTRKPTYRTLPRSGHVYEESHHFLESCHLCKKPLGGNKDIFMYRGNTPFCSVECRQQQIDIDEAAERSWSRSMKVAASRKEQQQKSGAASKGKTDNVRVRTGTVVAG